MRGSGCESRFQFLALGGVRVQSVLDLTGTMPGELRAFAEFIVEREGVSPTCGTLHSAQERSDRAVGGRHFTSFLCAGLLACSDQQPSSFPKTSHSAPTKCAATDGP